MPLLLTDRAVAVSPVPLLTAAACRMQGIPLSPEVLRRVRHGLYVERGAYERLPPWSKYAVRVHAFAMKHPEATLCLESAAVLHGLPSFGETRDIHVHSAERARSRRFGDVLVHTSSDPRAVERVSGVRVTGLLDTVVDLGRALSPAQALAVMDSATSPAQGGPLSLVGLRLRSDAQVNRRGRARLRWLWAHVDGTAESVSRAVILWSGFETPELQRSFAYEGSVDRVGFHFPSTRSIGEVDGWEKYGLGDPAAAAQSLVAEKRREDRLRRNGHPFARWEFADAWKVRPLQHALLAAGVERVAAPQLQLLSTLRSRR
ncbi:hypothetical protein [Microbacterium paludicola]|uniref:hypothetical protein n=1 Tax=Microbacterium paludicola TaxID=300019 RepID=UPI00119F3D9E|nr:hypothetical protein [Microbacterium paludicola]